jgi:heat shock protein HslJ
MLKPPRFKAVIFIALMILTACTGQAVIQEPTEAPVPTGTSPAGQPPPDLAPGDLEGVTWRLVAFIDRKGNQKSVLSEARLTIEFNGEQVSGSAGCNQFFASYLVDGESLTFSNGGVKEMYCTSPEGIMEQEAGYLAALQSVDTYRIADGRLQMMDDQGRTVLTYVVD